MESRSFPLSRLSIPSKTSSIPSKTSSFNSFSSRFPTSLDFHSSSSRQISCREMSAVLQNSPPTLQTVSISYSELQDKTVDLSAKIADGLGPNGLGILSISNVPGFSLLRKSLLDLSPRLAGLSEDEKKALEDPHSRYNFGWSHGKEKLESGKPAFKALGKLILEVELMLAYHCDRYGIILRLQYYDFRMQETL